MSSSTMRLRVFAATVAFGAVWLAWLYRGHAAVVVFSIVAAVGGLASQTDVAQRRVSNRVVVVGGMIVVVTLIASAVVDRRTGALGDAAWGAVAFAGPLLVVNLLRPRAMGMGDVKLAAIFGLVLGFVDPILCVAALAVALVLLGTQSVFAVVRGEPSSTQMAFAPALSIGTLVALLLATPILHLLAIRAPY
jgi:leader peptidase (prepilin peptidase)/N-methyltransferase